jgi:lactate dehydrogenase-like 2-hydroxyacid dehydrogenase
MNAKTRILQAGPLSGSPTADQRLAESYDVLALWKQPDPAAALAEHGKGITVMVTSSVRGADAALMDALPDLKAICNWGVGYDTIDAQAARARGLQISNTPDVLTDCVADLAWGLMIAGARRMSLGERFLREGRWGQVHGSIPLGSRVSGKRLGILGLGRIGEAIARRGIGFDMEVRYHNRHPRPGSPYGYEASLVELARWSDFLVVATVGGASTRHLVNQEVLQALGTKGLIVNISRGSVIDEQALVRVMEAGKLGGAALDVFENEPHVPQELKRSDAAVLLPHIGSATVETRLAMEDLVLENVASFLATGKLVTPVE